MRRIVTGLIAIACFCPLALRAEIVRFDITERAPAFSGRSFGSVGTYERITARATFALNPADDRNAVITDLALAPRNADGKVEATADVVKASSALRARDKWPAPTTPPAPIRHRQPFHGHLRLPSDHGKRHHQALRLPGVPVAPRKKTSLCVGTRRLHPSYA